MQNNLPIDLFHWILSLLPLAVLLIFLVGLRWKAGQAGPVGMFTAWAVALIFLRTPFFNLAAASAKGIWDSLFILYVVWPALLLYQVTQNAGAFEALRVGIRKFSRNRLFLVLSFGWVFSSFLQGISGFGTPIAVTAPLLLAIGVKPIYSVVIPLIGHAWANMFGTLAVGWLATLQVVDLANPTETALQTAILLWIPDLLAGFSIAWIFAGFKGIAKGWVFILTISIIHGAGQIAMVLIDPIISTFIPATVALMAIYPFSRWKLYRDPQDFDTKVMSEGGEEEQEEKPVMGLWVSLFPYMVLALVAIIGSAIPAVEDFLAQVQIGFDAPATTTGYGVVNEVEEPYSPFSIFTHPGTYLLIATLAGYLLYKSRGYYKKRASQEEQQGIWLGLASNAVPASIAITSFLVMSKVMDDSGQTEILALGISQTVSPAIYAFLSNWIGVLGAFMTSSNTASNILFAPLQQIVSQTEQGLSEASIIAAQSTGGAIGNAIAPANVVLGLSTIQHLGNTAKVLRITLVWAVIVAALTGAATILLNNIKFLGG